MLVQPAVLADLVNQFHVDGWQVVSWSRLVYQGRFTLYRISIVSVIVQITLCLTSSKTLSRIAISQKLGRASSMPKL